MPIKEKSDFISPINKTFYNTELNPLRYSQNIYSSRNNDLNSNSYSTKSNNFRTNSLKHRKLSSKILDSSIITPIFIDKSSFNNIETEVYDNFLKYRENASKNFKTRIKKEIDYLSNSFKKPSSSKLDSITKNTNKKNFDNFPLTYTTTVKSLKRYNKNKKSDFRYHMLPNIFFNDDEISILYKQIKEKRNKRNNNF